MHLALISLLFIISSLSFGQSDPMCGNTFEDIQRGCVLRQNVMDQLKKVDELRIKSSQRVVDAKESGTNEQILAAEVKENLLFGIPSDENQLKKMVGTVYLYRTVSGRFGKFIIESVERNRTSCKAVISSVTYKKNTEIVKQNSLVIEQSNGGWNIDRTSFDDRGTADFVLEKIHNICTFKMVGATAYQYKKITPEEEEIPNIILSYAGQFLIGLAIFLIARTVFQDEDRFKASESLVDAEQDDNKKTPNDIVLKYSRPFFRRYFSPIVQGMKSKRKIREKYKRQLASSGMNKFLTPEDFYAFKLFLIIGFPIVFIGVREFLEESWPLMYIPAVSVFGFFYPDIWIKGKIDQRREEVTSAMPFVVDMLALSVEAGLDFVAAMQKVIEKAPPSALTEEFEIMIKETKVGASRAESLRNLSWRIDSLPISSFCATLIAADSVGANIGPILKTLANELRQKRSALVEQKGAQAGTKILVPMIFFILPAVLLIIAAPMALQLMR